MRDLIEKIFSQPIPLSETSTISSQAGICRCSELAEPHFCRPPRPTKAPGSELGGLGSVDSGPGVRSIRGVRLLGLTASLQL